MELANQQQNSYHEILLPVFIRYLSVFLIFSKGRYTLLLYLWELNLHV